MITWKYLFFRCLFAFWKMLLKIFYGVWRDVKWRKKKHRNSLLSANPPPQCTVNPSQTTIKKTQQTHKHYHNKKTTTPANPANPVNPQIAALSRSLDRRSSSHRAAQPPLREAHREAQWPDRWSSSARKSREGGWVCARDKREGVGGLCEWVLENSLRKIFP